MSSSRRRPSKRVGRARLSHQEPFGELSRILDDDGDCSTGADLCTTCGCTREQHLYDNECSECECKEFTS
jgi:hypothetical protein